MHMTGRRALLPYQGSKWRYRKVLASVLAERGFAGEPAGLMLGDPSGWAAVLKGVFTRRDTVLGGLRRMAALDPLEVYDALHKAPVGYAYGFAAEYLFLQRLAFSGKSVCVDEEGCWRAPGFNRTSAYGVAATERFGEVKPQVPALIRRLEQWPETFDGAWYSGAWKIDDDAYDHVLAQDGTNTAVYIDPPYHGVTGYYHELPREVVLRRAQEFADYGALVVVSEAEPLPLPGWDYVLMAGPPDHNAPFRSKQAEWLTISPTR